MMGFKIVNTYQEMTRKQKIFFQLMMTKRDETKDRAMEIIERSKNGITD
jgi:hypothetical protein